MVEEAVKGEEDCGKLWRRRASAPIGGGGGGGGEAASAATAAGVAVNSVVAISAAGRW